MAILWVLIAFVAGVIVGRVRGHYAAKEARRIEEWMSEDL